MSLRNRFVTPARSERVIAILGGLFVLLGAAQVRRDVLTNGPPLEILFDLALFAALAGALFYGRHWLLRSDLRPDLYPRVTGWCLGGLALMLGVSSLLALNPDASLGHPLREVGFHLGIGSISGFAVGVMEARALSQATEAREHERALKESRDELRTLIELLPVAVFVAEADGRIVEWNEAAEEIWGGEIVESESVAEYDRYEAWWSDSGEPVAPEEWPLARALRGEAVTDPAEIEIKRFDGEFRTVLNHGKPVRDADGEVSRAVVTLIDITERKERERKLRRTERRFEAIFEDPNILVGLLEPDGTVLDINQTAMEYIDADLDDVTGEPFWETPWWGKGDDVAADVREWTQRAAAGEYVEFETDLTRPDGQRYTLNGAFRPVTNDDGEVVSIVVSDRDVSERREYERKLEESNERLEQFAYAASHDLQEPLRMISSYLRLIDDRYGDELDENGREFLDFAVDGADRMREMIEGLLEYSRVDTRGDPFEPVDLNDVLADVRNDLTVKISETDADITSEELPVIEGDAGQLRQLFQNLLDNALEYSGGEPPRVEISAEREGDEWTISVSDEGIGIAPDDADRVFEVFESLHATDEHSGTGIGLALCERIVERHGGDIWVESERGEGSTFHVTVPADDRPSERVAESAR